MLACVAGGCSDETGATAVQVALSVDSYSCGAGRPEFLPLGCDAELGVWLLDSTGRPASAGRCVALDADEDRTLSDLPALIDSAHVEFANLGEGADVALEVDIYSPDDDRLCPRFDPEIEEQSQAPVYYGRSSVVQLSGDRPVVPLTVECPGAPAPEPPLCGQPEPPMPLEITATVIDLESLAPLATALHSQTALSFGGLELTSAVEPAQFTRYADLIYAIPDASWFATLESAPEIVGCPATRVDEQAEALDVISCEAEEEEEPGGTQLSTVGYYVDLGVLPAVANIYDSIAPDGVVVGRVVDTAGSPVVGAFVSADETDAAIYYLSADRTTLSDVTGTTANGYFVILAFDGAACCHTLTAETADAPPLTGASLAPVALVRDALTATLVVLQ